MSPFRILPVITSDLTEQERKEREKKEEKEELKRAKKKSQKRNPSEITINELRRVATYLIEGADRNRESVKKRRVAAMRDMLAAREEKIKNADQQQILQNQKPSESPPTSFRIGGKKYKKFKKQNKRKTKRKKLTKRR
jgi:hypothetical protein